MCTPETTTPLSRRDDRASNRRSRSVGAGGISLAALWLALLAAPSASATEPVHIGITTILSGPNADRGQSEQFGVELALQRVNDAGGVLGRRLEALYGDHGANPAAGVAAAKRLIEQQHVSVLVGALSTPVTRAVMPVAKDAKVPFVIDISTGQEFVDAAGSGGNDYVFKTSPSDLDVAAAVMQRLKAQGVRTVAVVADDIDFNLANKVAAERAAATAGIRIVAVETVPKGSTDLSAIVARLDAAHPDRIVCLLSASNAPFFRAYQASANIPLAGRIDFPSALAAVSPQFIAAGGLDRAESVTAFNGALDAQGVQDFMQAYRGKYGIAPNQRAFFAYETILVIADAIQRAHSTAPAEIQKALKSSNFPSALGGNYTMDGNNHAHTWLQLVTVQGSRPSVAAISGL
ncbi:MAG: ABC transporter substrate-binding protein [Pseudomonadota bacterium]